MADNKLNLVVQFMGIDKLSGAMKNIIGWGKSSKQALRDLNAEAVALNKQISELGERMKAAGKIGSLGIGEMAAAQKALGEQLVGVNSQIARQRNLLTIEGDVARARRRGQSWANSGMSMLMWGGMAAAPLYSAVHEAQDYQREMARIDALGLGNGVAAHADKFAQAAKIFGNSTRDIIHAYGDALSIFKNTREADFVTPLMARMKFANQALYGEEEGGQRDEALMSMMKVIEFRGGTSSEANFANQANFAQKIVNASRGRVNGAEMLLAMKRGGILARSMSDKAFFLDSEPLMQEFGGNGFGTGLTALYNSLGQGHGTIAAQQEMLRLGLLDKGKVEFNKLGALKKMMPGAFDMTAVRKDGILGLLDQVLLPAFAKAGIKGDTATIDEIGRLLTPRAAALVSSAYLQRDKLRTQARANEQAAGIGDTEKIAKESYAGKMIELTARWKSFQEVLGRKGGVMDVAILGLTKLTGAIAGLTAAANAHPTAFRWVGTAVTGLIGLNLALGAGKLALGNLYGPASALWGFFEKREIFARLIGSRAMGGMVNLLIKMPGKMGNVASAAFRLGDRIAGATADVIAFGIQSASATLLSGIARLRVAMVALGGAFRAAGVWMLANPIVLITAALVAGGIAIYVYRKQIGQAFMAIRSWFAQQPAWFRNIGAMILQGLINAFPAAALAQRLLNMSQTAKKAFMDFWGIKSPSRLMIAMGGHIATGLGVGVDRHAHQPLRAITRLAAGTAAGFAVAATPAAARTGLGQGPKIEIHIHQLPGEDSHQLARRVADIIDKRARRHRHASYRDDY